MLEITAKENATIAITNGEFPLGQRNSIKVNIEDELLKEHNSTFKTGICKKEYNYYTYGNFDELNTEYIKVYNETNEREQENPENYLTISQGYKENSSNCLHCITTDKIISIDFLTNNDSLISYDDESDTFIVSFDFISLKGTVTAIIGTAEYDLSKYTEWFKFKADSKTYDKITLKVSKNSEFYLDNLYLFNSKNEIIDHNLKAEIKIINPCYYDNKGILDNTFNWTDNSVMFDMPSNITSVDYQDNILCQLIFYYFRPKYYNYLDNYIYNKEKDIIYTSENFTLHGYVMPDSCSCDTDIYWRD